MKRLFIFICFITYVYSQICASVVGSNCNSPAIEGNYRKNCGFYNRYFTTNSISVTCAACTRNLITYAEGNIDDRAMYYFQNIERVVGAPSETYLVDITKGKPLDNPSCDDFSNKYNAFTVPAVPTLILNTHISTTAFTIVADAGNGIINHKVDGLGCLGSDFPLLPLGGSITTTSSYNKTWTGYGIWYKYGRTESYIKTVGCQFQAPNYLKCSDSFVYNGIKNKRCLEANKENKVILS